MLLKFGKKIYGRYGFADAFNPTTGWVSRYVIGIDVGITLLSAENLRTQDVWYWFMSDSNVERALDMVGLVPNSLPAAPQNGARLAEAGKGISGLKTRTPSSNGEFPQEIPLTHDHKIPAAGYKYKIPIPPH
jgi:Putative glucoamylase